MLRDALILQKVPQLADLVENEEVIVLTKTNAIRPGSPNKEEYRRYLRKGTKLLSHDLHEAHETESYYYKETLDERLKFEQFFNGTFRETFNGLATSDGTTVTLTLTSVDGKALTMQFSDGLFPQASGAKIALTAGSDASPTMNYVYILQSTKALTVSTSDFPNSAEHIKIGRFLVPSAGFVQTNGCYINQNDNDHDVGSDNQGHLAHIADRQRRMSARYISGIAGNGTDGYLTPAAGNVELKATSGVVYQVHRHAVSAFDTSDSDQVLVKNWNGDSYHDITNLYDIVADSGGNTITNNKYFSIVIWGVVNKSGEYTPMMINLPSGFYNTQAGAVADNDGYDDFSIPSEFGIESSTGFLVARITIQMKTGGGTWAVASTVDLRGFNPQSATGGAASFEVEFPDNTFRIYDEGDVTKILAFDVGALVATGTTRTLQIPNESGVIAIASGAYHDGFSDFVPDEHVLHAGVSIVAGAGMTGGGNISASRTLNVIGSTGITVNADSVQTNDGEIVHDNLSGFVGNEHIDHTGVAITVGTGLDLTGSSDISASFNINLDLTEVIATDGANRVLTSDGDGTLTAEANLGFDGSSLRVGTAGLEGIRLGQKLDIANSANYGGNSLSTWSANDAHCALLDFNKSGSSTIGTHAAVADDEKLGFITFRGSDGVEFLDAASIRGEVDGAITGGGTNDMPGRLVFLTSADGAASPIERVRIDSTGNVGIGLTDPNAPLAFYNNSAADAEVIRDKEFSSGWAGVDWSLSYISSNATLELDDLWVRGALNVYELIINQISAVNGGMVISAANGRVASVSGSPSTEAVVFEDPESTTITQFAPGDIMLIQNVNLDSTTVVKRIVREVNTISGMTVTCKALSDAPADGGVIAKGDVVVVIGNTKGGSASANVLSAAQYAGTSGWASSGGATITNNYTPVGSGNEGHEKVVRIEADTGAFQSALPSSVTFTSGKDYIFEFDYKTVSALASTHSFRLMNAGFASSRYLYAFPTSSTWTHLRLVIPESDLSSGTWSDIVYVLMYVNFNADGAASDEMLIDNISARIAGTVRDASIFMTSTDAYSPYIQIMDEVDSWAAWKDPDKIKAVFGNLEGKYGYVTETYGFAAGDKTEQYLTIDPTNGIRILDGSESDNVLLQASGDLLTVGDNFNYTSSTATLKIGGWTIDTFDIAHVFDTDRTLVITAQSNDATIYFFDATPTTGDIRWLGMGRLYDGSDWTSEYGIGAVQYNGATYDKLFWLSDVSNEIAGWTINATTLEKLASNIGVKLDAGNSKIQVGDLDEQRIDILGADGTVNWYKSDGAGGSTLVVTIDDTIDGTYPGVRVLGGNSTFNAYEDANNWANLRSHNLFIRQDSYNVIELSGIGGGSLHLRNTSAGAPRVADLSFDELLVEDLPTDGSAGTPVHWYSGGAFKRYTSSLRYKEDVTALEIKTDRIYGLEVKSYTSKASGDRTFGLIAEEVYLVAPDLINMHKGQPDSIKGPLLDYMMLEELKKLRKEVDQLIANKEKD